MTPVVFESIIFALLALLALTQVIIPAWRGMPLFPCFRLRSNWGKLDDAQADVMSAEREAEIETRKRLAAHLRKQKETHTPWQDTDQSTAPAGQSAQEPPDPAV